jgi:hypothetical protein
MNRIVGRRGSNRQFPVCLPGPIRAQGKSERGRGDAAQEARLGRRPLRVAPVRPGVPGRPHQEPVARSPGSCGQRQDVCLPQPRWGAVRHLLQAAVLERGGAHAPVRQADRVRAGQERLGDCPFSASAMFRRSTCSRTGSTRATGPKRPSGWSPSSVAARPRRPVSRRSARRNHAPPTRRRRPPDGARSRRRRRPRSHLRGRPRSHRRERARSRLRGRPRSRRRSGDCGRRALAAEVRRRSSPQMARPTRPMIPAAYRPPPTAHRRVPPLCRVRAPRSTSCSPPAPGPPARGGAKRQPVPKSA